MFRSVAELTLAIEEPLRVHNANPKPILWTAFAADILEKVQRGRRKLDKVQTAWRATLVLPASSFPLLSICNARCWQMRINRSALLAYCVNG